MEQTIHCRCFCNRDDLRLFRRYHNACLLGIHHKVTSVNIFKYRVLWVETAPTQCRSTTRPSPFKLKNLKTSLRREIRLQQRITALNDKLRFANLFRLTFPACSFTQRINKGMTLAEIRTVSLTSLRSTSLC